MFYDMMEIDILSREEVSEMRKRSRVIRPCGAMRRRPSQTGIPWIAALLMLATSSCDPARRDTQTAPARDSAGVTIIDNRGPDEMLGARAVRMVDLVPPDSALTAVPWGVAADPMTGRIYVADWTGERVVAFDASGAYAGSYGRSGDGPGEFRSPSAVSMDPYGALTVWDTGRQILNRWSSEGDLLNEQRPELAYWGPGFAVGSDWLATVTSATSSSGMVTEQRLVVERGQTTTTLHEVPMELRNRPPRCESRIPSQSRKYEVMLREWDACVDAGGCTYVPDDNGWGRGDRPAINLARPDVDQYVTWIGERTGHAYRLPSEAEWEYAARGGTTTTRYWGDGLGAGMVTCEGCPGRPDLNHTTPAGSFPANPFGLHDTIGNVTEWVADCWNDTHEGNPGDGSARIQDSPWWRDGACERPVWRGSSWSSFSWSVTAAYRGFYHPGPWNERETKTGFRLVRSIASDSADGPTLAPHPRRQVQP